MEFVAVGLVVVAALGVAALRFAAAARRRAALFQLADSFGLEFSAVDPFGLIDHRFDLFNRADAARCDNVMWGDWHGVQVKTGELRFKADPAREGQYVRTRKRFSFAVVEIKAWVPHLTIRLDPLAALSESLLLDRLRFESDEFNRTYRVECGDEAFAYRFVDARMVLWLQGLGEAFKFDFEVRGDLALVSCPRLKPTALVPLFGAAKGFVDHIPRVALRDDAPTLPS